MKTSPNGYALIKSFEGCELVGYLCPAGVVSIGWGHTRTAQLGMCITPQKAEDLLVEDVTTCEDGVNKFVRVPLNQNQFDAIIDFVFNLGTTKFRNSTLLMRLNGGDYDGAAKELLKWDKAKVDGKKTALAGLTRRRQAEYDLFTKKVVTV